VHYAAGPSVTLSVRGCVAVFPNFARITVGEFTCEPRAECPSFRGMAWITEGPLDLTADALFVPSLIPCTFFESPVSLGNVFHCGDSSGNTTVGGSFRFVPGQQPACAPGS